MWTGTEFTGVDIPPEVGLIHLTTIDFAHQFVVVCFTNGTSDNLTDLWEENVGTLHCWTRSNSTLVTNGTAVGCFLILLHVERLERTWVVGHDNRTLEVFLYEVTLVFAGEVIAPVTWKLKLLAVLDCLLKDVDTFGVRQTDECLLQYTFETCNESLVNHLVEELKVITTVVESPTYTILDEVLFEVHQFFLVEECHFGFNHPEFSKVTWGVAVLGTERRTESVDGSECCGSEFAFELTTYGE